MLQFWLSFNNGAERLRLPVNPQVFQVNTGQGFTDVEVSQLGEYTIIGASKLREFAFSSFFPRDYHPGYCEYNNIPRPWDAVKKIEEWQKSGRPCRLTITGTPINYAVTIRDFSVEEKGGEVGDLYYTLALKEFKFVQFKTVKVEAPKVKPVPQRPPAQKPSTSGKTYVVKKGDSLWKIAQAHLGAGSKWTQIYDKNKSVIGKNPNLIHPGQKLVLP